MILTAPVSHVIAGVAAGLGVQWMLVWGARRRETLYFWFAWFCLTAAVFNYLVGERNAVADHDSAISFYWWSRFLLPLITISGFGFLSRYLGEQKIPIWLAIVIVVNVAYLFDVVTGPATFPYKSIETWTDFVTPWGETLHRPLGPQVAGWAETCQTPVTLAALLRLLVGCIALGRQGKRLRAISMAVYLLLQIGSIVIGLAAEARHIGLPNIAGLPMFFFIIFMSASLGEEIRQQGVALANSLTTLSKTVTELQQTEAARHRAELDRDAKSMFLAHISHEIRTPMNAIIGNAYLALKLPLSAKVKEYLHRVYAAGTGLLGIINDILDSTKIEFGKLRIEHVPFDLHATVKDALDAVITRADEKGLRCKLTVAQSVPRVVIGDALRVRQVLTNILGNAVKFTERGSVTLEVSSNAPESADAVEFTVTDTGIGIADDQIQRLFEPFSQADDSTTRRFGGTGLGLSISRRLVDLMDGRLSVTSVVGKGSQFRIALPLPAADADASIDVTATHASADHRYDGVCILCVDDNAENRNLAVELLHTVGAQAVVAADGQEGIDQLFAHPSRFDLVLMDIHMPRLDGYEATQRIRARQEFSELPIVAATASASPEEWAKCLAVGMNDYLVKPISPNLLFAKLRQWIRRSGSVATSAPVAGKTSFAASVNIADVPRCREQLIDYLEECDSIARDFFEEHEATVVYGLPGDAAARLANFVRTYRYDHALDELRRIGAATDKVEEHPDT